MADGDRFAAVADDAVISLPMSPTPSLEPSPLG
jgi:hypothetical protein